MRLLLGVLVTLALLAGCTAPAPPSGLVSVNGVSNASGGNVDLVGEGIAVAPNSTAGTVGLALPAMLRHNGTIEACRDTCANLSLPDGAIVADLGLVSLGNLSLNAGGPDRNSAVFFFDEGQLGGQFLRWNKGRETFELSRGLDALGNVTARHHVGTVTAVSLGGAQTGRVVQVATAALEGNHADVFLRGSAALTNGTATIAFPAPFRVLVAGNLTAQVTPTSRGAALWVAEKTGDHITVETMDGSLTNETFDYFVQATRAASEDFETVSAS